MPGDCPIVVLISGRGSNLRSLLANARSYKIIAVLSDKEDAPGLQFAKAAGVETYAFPRGTFNSKQEQKDAIFSKIAELSPRFICLAGFMQVISPKAVEDWYGKIINIHPSVLPEFPGLHTHERALEAKAPKHGCSVHFVDAEIDGGPIIAQAEVPVLPNDTPDTLGGRVLEREHVIYPWAINALAQGEITLEGRVVRYSPAAIESGSTLKFHISATVEPKRNVAL